MNNFIAFVKAFAEKIQKDDLLSIANELTYKILFAVFPFIIFLMSIIGFLELEVSYLMDQLFMVLPEDLFYPAKAFIEEIVYIKRPSVMSFSAIIAVYGSSSGFQSLMKGINKAYEQKDTRKFWVQKLISIALVTIFTLTIIATLAILIFGEDILNLFYTYFETNWFLEILFGFIGSAITIIVMFFAVLLINKMASAHKPSFKSLIPGSVVTVILWVAASFGFNIYANNFARYSAVYGSVAAIMILMLWLNVMCTVLMIGSEINALLFFISQKSQKQKK